MTEDNKKHHVRLLARAPKDALIAEETEGGTLISHITAAEEGKPIDPEKDLFQLKKTETEGVYEKVVLYKGKGPAKVSSPAYREGWDAVFGPKPRREDMN